MVIAQRTEIHIIRESHPCYGMLWQFCRLSKNLYNQANYLCRQGYFKDGNIPSYNSLDKILKAETKYPDYRNMPTAQCAQQTLKCLCGNWKAFRKTSVDYRKHPKKYKAKPRCPDYLEKTGCYVLVLTNQTCKLRNGIIRFPKVFDGFIVKTCCDSQDDFLSFQQVRIVPKSTCLSLEVIYNVQVLDPAEYNGRAAGMDLGVNNLAVVCNNFHGEALLVNGRPLKSVNQYYNRRKAAMQKELKKRHDRYSSRRLSRLMVKRNAKIYDYMHKASRMVIDWCVENQVTKLVVGRNKDWKQKCRIGNTRKDQKRNNQNFVSIPFYRFEQILSYKAEKYGIAVIFVDEAFTSGTSAVDHEPADALHYDRSRRIHRGLFRSDSGILINADLNAAYQILGKEVPFQWDRGCVLHPVARKIA